MGISFGTPPDVTHQSGHRFYCHQRPRRFAVSIYYPAVRRLSAVYHRQFIMYRVVDGILDVRPRPAVRS